MRQCFRECFSQYRIVFLCGSISVIINTNFLTISLYFLILVLKRKRFVASLKVRILLYILA
jgi:hypothetical protein